MACLALFQMDTMFQMQGGGHCALGPAFACGQRHGPGGGGGPDRQSVQGTMAQLIQMDKGLPVCSSNYSSTRTTLVRTASRRAADAPGAHLLIFLDRGNEWEELVKLAQVDHSQQDYIESGKGALSSCGC